MSSSQVATATSRGHDRHRDALSPGRRRLHEFQAAAFPLAGRRQGRDHHAQPAGAEEPADARILRRAARHVPQSGLCRRHQDHRDHRRRRQFLLRRRRARDHRPAGRDAAQGRHGGPARLHAHDRRSGQGDARLSAADRRRRSTASAPAPARSSRWRRTCASARRAARSPSCSCASGSPAPTWAPATCCRASSAHGRAAELLYTGRAMDGAEAERWGFYNKLCEPETVLADAQALAKIACRTARPSPTP